MRFCSTCACRALNGLRVLARLREKSNSPHVPVIVLSASLRDQNRALHAGARFFMTKPFSGDELLQAVRRVLAESQQDKSNCRAADAVGADWRSAALGDSNIECPLFPGTIHNTADTCVPAAL